MRNKIAFNIYKPISLNDLLEMGKLSLFILSASVILQTGLSLNILGLFPHPAISHFKVFQPLLRELAHRGHNLTIISPFPLKEPIPGYNDISLAKDTKIIMNAINMDSFKKSIFRYYLSPLFIANMAESICEKLKSETMLDFLKNEDTFHLIITEVFCNDCFMGFIYKYKVPVVGLSSTMVMPYNNGFFGKFLSQNVLNL